MCVGLQQEGRGAKADLREPSQEPVDLRHYLPDLCLPAVLPAQAIGALPPLGAAAPPPPPLPAPPAPAPPAPPPFDPPGAQVFPYTTPYTLMFLHFSLTGSVYTVSPPQSQETLNMSNRCRL